MSARFEKLGVSFQYPENWTLDEEDARAGNRSVTVYSPGGAFWSVAIHSRSADPAQLVKAAVDAMQEEYEQLEQESVQETVAGRELIGFDLNFFYLDLTSTAQIRCLTANQAIYTIFCQGEDRDFAEVRLVFQAMTASLLSELKDLGYGD